MSDCPRSRLASLRSLEEAQIDLAEAALWVAAAVDPAVDPKAERARFAELAADAACGTGAGDGERLARLTRLVYDELGFVGDCETYHHPDNSLLPRVLDRRRGIPLSLAIVLIELGERLGVPLVGVGFPGHFLVRHAAQHDLVLDPFAGGRPLTRCECAELLGRAGVPQERFHPRLLLPAPRLGVIVRLLDNLHCACLRNEQPGEALVALDLSLLLRPEDPGRIRTRGMLRLRLCDFCGAASDLDRYLELMPDAPDGGTVRELVRCARRRRLH